MTPSPITAILLTAGTAALALALLAAYHGHLLIGAAWAGGGVTAWGVERWWQGRGRTCEQCGARLPVARAVRR